MGALLIAYATLFFFGLPRSFIEEDFVLFFSMLNIILIAMLLGLTSIIQIVQPLVESAFLWILVPPMVSTLESS